MDIKFSPGYEADRLTPIFFPVRTISAQVIKTMEGKWRYTLSIGYGPSAYFREEGTRTLRKNAIACLWALLCDHFNHIPAMTTFQVNAGAKRAFPASTSYPFQKRAA